MNSTMGPVPFQIIAHDLKGQKRHQDICFHELLHVSDTASMHLHSQTSHEQDGCLSRSNKYRFNYFCLWKTTSAADLSQVSVNLMKCKPCLDGELILRGTLIPNNVKYHDTPMKLAYKKTPILTGFIIGSQNKQML